MTSGCQAGAAALHVSHKPTLLALCDRDVQQYIQRLEAFSKELQLPISGTPVPTVVPEPSSLALFGAASALASSLPGQEDCNFNDVIFFVGGPIWALDWCPQLESTGQSYIALGAHNQGQKQNPVGHTLAGPTLLQLWAIPGFTLLKDTTTFQTLAGVSEGQPPFDARLPYLLYGVALEGGIVRDCKWCPDPAKLEAVASGVPTKPNNGAFETTRLGILAVLLGTGEVQVLAMPKNPASQEGCRSNSSQGRGAKPLGQAVTDVSIVRIAPVAQAPAGILGASCGSTLEWLPHEPHDLLLVGCWDGTVALFRISASPAATARATSEGSPRTAGASDGSCNGMMLLLHFQADSDPIRAVAWVHASFVEACSDLAHRHIFATAGHGSQARIWDARSPAQPLFSATVAGRAWILGMIWDASGLLVVQDEGSMHHVSLNSPQTSKDPVSSAFIGELGGAMWSLHKSPNSGATAYAGADGVVIVAPPDFQYKTRVRPPHTPIAGFLQEGPILKVRLPCEAAKAGLAFGGKAGSPNYRLPARQEAIHCVRWSCLQENALWSWLAHGGAAGIVRCQRVASSASAQAGVMHGAF